MGKLRQAPIGKKVPAQGRRHPPEGAGVFGLSHETGKTAVAEKSGPTENAAGPRRPEVAQATQETEVAQATEA